MSGSKLIELSYYDPSVQVRLSAYADTVVLDHNEKGGVICAIRFGGYPEMVRAMADAIYGGATIEATQNDTVRLSERVSAAADSRRCVCRGNAHGQRRRTGGKSSTGRRRGTNA